MSRNRLVVVVLAPVLLAGVLLAVGLYRGGHSMQPAELSLGRTGPTPEQTVIEVIVIDPCPRGTPPGPGLTAHEIDLEVRETNDAVIVTAKAPVPRRGACNLRLDPVPVSIVLDQPFGHRVLRDGQFDPPRSPTFDVYNRNPPDAPPTTENPYGDLVVPEHLQQKWEQGESLETETLPTPTIDSEALLARYGFERCDTLIPHPELTDERRQEIFTAIVEADIGSGASMDPGYRLRLSLYVLDEPTLLTLTEFADPSEVCLRGQDPNDYIPLGPQALKGPGWRWVGAGTGSPTGGSALITNRADYDELWPHLGEGPEVTQLAVDFEREVILAISHGSGVNFGRCGVRFDGYHVEDETVIINWARPGGHKACQLSINTATYAVAIDRNLVDSGKLTVVFRNSPDDDMSQSTNIFPGKVIATQTEDG